MGLGRCRTIGGVGCPEGRIVERGLAGAEAGFASVGNRFAASVGAAGKTFVSLRDPGLVVLPDHLHSTARVQEVEQRMGQLPSIRTLPSADENYVTHWRLIKLHFAKCLPKQKRLSALRKRPKKRGIWQGTIWNTRYGMRQVKMVHPFRVDAMMILSHYLHCMWASPFGYNDFSGRGTGEIHPGWSIRFFGKPVMSIDTRKTWRTGALARQNQHCH
jgi:hypothetical protein